MRGTCKQCRFWERIFSSQEGNCKRHSPAVDASFSYGYWPKTLEDDWCGDFEIAENRQ